MLTTHQGSGGVVRGSKSLTCKTSSNIKSTKGRKGQLSDAKNNSVGPFEKWKPTAVATWISC